MGLGPHLRSTCEVLKEREQLEVMAKTIHAEISNAFASTGQIPRAYFDRRSAEYAVISASIEAQEASQSETHIVKSTWSRIAAGARPKCDRD